MITGNISRWWFGHFKCSCRITYYALLTAENKSDTLEHVLKFCMKIQKFCIHLAPTCKCVHFQFCFGNQTEFKFKPNLWTELNLQDNRISYTRCWCDSLSLSHIWNQKWAVDGGKLLLRREYKIWRQLKRNDYRASFLICDIRCVMKCIFVVGSKYTFVGVFQMNSKRYKRSESE